MYFCCRFPFKITIDEFKTFYVEVVSNLNFLYNISEGSNTILKKLRAMNITAYKDIFQLFENKVHDSGAVWQKFFYNTCYFGREPCDMYADFRETLHWRYSSCHEWNFYKV